MDHFNQRSRYEWWRFKKWVKAQLASQGGGSAYGPKPQGKLTVILVTLVAVLLPLSIFVDNIKGDRDDDDQLASVRKSRLEHEDRQRQNLSQNQSQSSNDSLDIASIDPERLEEMKRKARARARAAALNPDGMAEEAPIAQVEVPLEDHTEHRQVLMSDAEPVRVEPANIPEPMAESAPIKETALEHAKKHTDPKFVCPMHPDIITDGPSTCPICGMDLVPMDTSGEPGEVKVSSDMINMLGVRTEKVKRKTLYRRIDSVGYIGYDEKKIRNVSLRTEGWVEHLAVKTEGDAVDKGQLLFEVYAPKLVNAQEEYIEALNSGVKGLLTASRKRLRALGVSDAQITVLAKDKKVQQLVRVYAPQSGVISELSVREGEFVPPSKAVVTLVDLDTVWLLVDIFERQAQWVSVGQRAEATLPFMVDKTWEGQVEYVYPSIDAKTRSLKVRLRFDNKDGSLKPNMYANVTIFASPKRQVLSVPREAVIRVGDEQRVIMAIGDGRFKPVKVRTGIESNDRTEIISGLEEDNEIVVSSQFLIDSESSLRASMSRMSAGE